MITSPTIRYPLRFSLFPLVCLLTAIVAVDGHFNYEVKKRVVERMNDFMNDAVVTNSLTSKYRNVGAFPHNMDARDRDKYLEYAYTFMQQFKYDGIYIALEDGLFLGYGKGWGTYREPANSYNTSDLEPNDAKYFFSCVNRETGEEEKCTMADGSKYIQCIHDCEVKVCPDAQSQMCSRYEQQNTASNLPDGECQPNSIKWCPQYDVLESSSNLAAEHNIMERHENQQTLGFVPRFYYCHDENGRFTQQIGKVLQSDGVTLGNCYYGDGATLVDRSEVANYEYCNGKKCNALAGAYRSRDYDHRYRQWYRNTKELQQPNWSPPFAFFSELKLGITYSQPIYSQAEESTKNDGKLTFAGVLAVDYTFEDISNFLQTSYLNTSTSVIVFEKEEPNYIVASSTGRKPSRHVLTDDPTKPCPDSLSADSMKICTVKRYNMEAFVDGESTPMDKIISRAYQMEREKGYPSDELSIVKATDRIGSKIYLSQTAEYRNGNLEWIILVLLPAEDTGESYSLTVGEPLFGLVCLISIMGFGFCIVQFVLFYRKRASRAVTLRDWRFTCAFIMGCAFVNLSSLTLLGPNTDTLCLTRMWSFHLLFVMTISPLFVKIWRIYVLAGPSRGIRKITVTNKKAVLYTMPFIVAQAFILLGFSIWDPPRQEEVITLSEGVVTQQIICGQKAPLAFFTIEIVFEAGLVLTGCVLAYVTRTMNEDFGEAPQLIFSMYNIAFIAVTTSIAYFILDVDRAGQIASVAMGVCWGTIFSSAAFVVPILLQVKKDETAIARDSASSTQVRISGLDSDFWKTIKPTPNGRLSASFRLKQLDNDELHIIPEFDGLAPLREEEECYFNASSAEECKK